MDHPFLIQYESIAKQFPGYEPRPAQAAMACGIMDALSQGKHLAVEAGTGSGKSFGYLIPALLQAKRPIVISTGTIALQEQLLEKDIPFIAKAADMPDLKAKLVKGRRNYLCIQKMTEFERTLNVNAPERLFINLIKSSLEEGWNGDRATFDLEIPEDIWEEVRSDSEDCLGKKCQFYNENPYRLAREDLDEADILVVNHALYFQDLIAGQSLLPPHEVVIFDEAHQMRNYALKAFTARIGKFATHKLLRKIDRRLTQIPREYQDAIYETEAKVLQWLFQQEKSTYILNPDERFLGLVAQQVLILNELRTWLGSINIKQLNLVSDPSEEDRVHAQKAKLLSQLDGLTIRWELFLQPHHDDVVNWVEQNPHRLYYELKSTPLNISEQLQTTLWGEKTAIFTSATLSMNRNLSYFRSQLGLPQDRTAPDLILESPFSFETQCELYLPQNLPEPNDPLFLAHAGNEITQILNHTDGRAFVLFTSYSAMDKLSGHVIPQITFPCKTQGDLPKQRLIEWFKNTPNAVLFATASFWEGIDIPGDALSCVIIDRIPFSQPDEPVQAATVNRLKRNGEDWFNGFVLPEATIRLKQGFGRLIRTQQDKGLVAILDSRLTQKGYGSKVLRSLPKSRVIQDLTESQVFMRRVPVSGSF